MQAIAEGIYYENSYPGVTLGAVIMQRGTLMIDTPLRAEDARTWKSVLLTQSRGAHRLVINLDAHPDRTLGTRSLDCTILAHEKTAEVFENRGNVFKGQNDDTSAEWERYPDVIGSRWASPNITFSDSLQLHWGEPEILLEHHPGPSSGSIWVIIPEAKIVFIGDTVLPQQPPFLADANISDWVESINLLTSRKYKDYTIISGRGGLIDVEVAREQRQILKNIHRKLESMAEKEEPPIETEKLIAPILESIDVPAKLQIFYRQRLHHGLQQYYLKHYYPDEVEDEL